MLQVMEMFKSIEGEGLMVGTPTMFIRHQGCSVHCIWCDTKKSWPTDGGQAMTVANIIDVVKRKNPQRVSITGGNPMEQDLLELATLIYELTKLNIAVNIEHPGVFINDVFQELAFLRRLESNVTVSFDLKPLTSQALKNNYDALSMALVDLTTAKCAINLKSVFSTKGDLADIFCFINNLGVNIPVSLTPNSTVSIPKDVYEEAMILMDSRQNIRIIPQIHTFIPVA